jgi:hypothetical protein
VISGAATVDGRPLLWKNRDTAEPENEVAFFGEGTYAAVGVTDAGDTGSVWMGLNSAGFAIENSYSPDLEGEASRENGIYMKRALLHCATVDDFELLLAASNSAGRGTNANFGVIDATGAAAVFETGNHTYARYNAAGPSATLPGCVVRTNFGETGDGTGEGRDRYKRAVNLLIGRLSASGISHEFILKRMTRDLWTEQVDPYPLPYPGSTGALPAGFIETVTSINRSTTRSSAVFQGVLPGEDPRLSTMWVILGEPVCAVAVPVWPWGGGTPEELDGEPGSPLCEAANIRRAACYSLGAGSNVLDTYALDDGRGGGLWSRTRPLEDWIFTRIAAALAEWRTNPPSADRVWRFEESLISQAFAGYCYGSAPADRMEAPLDFLCREVENRALLLTETIHVLSWSPNTANQVTTGYRVYREEDGTAARMAELEASAREYLCRRVDPHLPQTYFLVALDAQSRESRPAVIFRFDR